MSQKDRVDVAIGDIKLRKPLYCAAANVNNQRVAPASISVLGPNRSSLGPGVPVPSSVTSISWAVSGESANDATISKDQLRAGCM